MYDITIIGAGVSSVFLAYQLQKSNPHITVHIIDKGKQLEGRICSLDKGEPTCHCEVCPKYFGFAGLGKSEGKFNYTNDFGGHLGEKIGYKRAYILMKEVDHILCLYGANQVELYSTKDVYLEEKARKHGLEILSTEVRHLGTVLASKIFQQLYLSLREVSFTFETDIHSITKQTNGFALSTNKGTFKTKKLVLATGMSGSDWMQKQASDLGIPPAKTRVDLGLRIEMSRKQMAPLLKTTFETKLRYRGEDFQATTYCMNPGGRVIRKYQNGLVMADGQNYREKGEPTDNLNFSLFVPKYFDRYEEATIYAQSIIQKINQGKGRLVVQRLGDLRKKQATFIGDLQNNSIIPSLTHIEAGNIKNEVPELYIRAFLEMASSLESLVGEPLLDDTLLYAIDAKFYEAMIETNEQFETSIPDLFLIGDCSGVTHSLSQAAASGLFLGKYLSNNCTE
ncbi:NAD(P)-binding protein [Bacillus carboniphilus]|uniref:NAD(P)-binding protein n=1 Tax=Bacillus carboniphilus TaxID=86663 RepID=A0ABY9JV29_9BACI|nr:NAD(P)-binding protein [Bacillus carboniphilus]WLR42578.1 NAD(P)-binding protein [Bacillus carboniphilus]